MVIDHVGGQSPLHALTGGDHFFTSAAEGFIAISGFVVGHVYRQIAAEHGLGVALRRLLERAWLLCLIAVGLTLVILPTARLFDLPWVPAGSLEDPRGVLWAIFTLHQTGYLADVALLYALLLGIAPLAFILLTEGRAWLLLGISWGLWLVYQIHPEGVELPWVIGNNAVFHFSAWQVLFISAMALGYHRDAVRMRLEAAWDGPGLAVATAGVAALVLVFATQSGARDAVTDTSAWWLAKNSLGPGRILASGIVFGLAWLGASQLWLPLRRTLGWLLLPLGQNALFAYSAHVLIVLAVAIQASALSRNPLPQSLTDRLPDAGVINLLLQIGTVATLWLAIRLKAHRRVVAARGSWLAGPAPVLIAATLLLWANPTQGQAASSPSQPAAAINPLGTPIPVDQAATIARELSAAADAHPQTAQMAPMAAPTPRPVAPPRPTPPPKVSIPLPAIEPTRPPALAGQPWAGSAGPAGATLQGSLRQVQFHSQALDRDMPYLIYLPPGYGLQNKRYPAVYLLHGAGQRVDEWLSYGIVETADRLIDSSQISPVLLVMPLGDLGYWVNHVEDGPRWGDYVADDLVQQVDATFRTKAEARYRAIGGISMGGYGALVNAFNNPQVFHHVAADSPALHPEGSLAFLGTGDDYAQRDPVSLAGSVDLNGLGIWLDMGASDPWLPRVTQLDHALNTRGIVHSWTLGDGGHDGGYWQRSVPAYLRFYNAGFN
jgi:enterochelin esterase-like enzyme